MESNFLFQGFFIGKGWHWLSARGRPNFNIRAYLQLLMIWHRRPSRPLWDHGAERPRDASIGKLGSNKGVGCVVASKRVELGAP